MTSHNLLWSSLKWSLANLSQNFVYLGHKSYKVNENKCRKSNGIEFPLLTIIYKDTYKAGLHGGILQIAGNLNLQRFGLQFKNAHKLLPIHNEITVFFGDHYHFTIDLLV